MTVNTDIGFIARGSFTRNGVIRANHPDTFARLSNGLYSKYRKVVHQYFYDDLDAFVPTGASYTQVNSNTGVDLSVFNPVCFLGDSLDGRVDGLLYSMILHVFGEDCKFKAVFEDTALTMEVTCGASAGWYKVETTNAFTSGWDNVSFECIDDGTTPQVRGWKLEEAIIVL